MKKTIIRALGVAGASIALVMGMNSPAFASANGPKVCNSGPQSACAQFLHDGDIVRVWDTNCDAHAAVAHVWSNEAGIYNNLWNRNGCGTYLDYAYGTSMPEDVAVYYQACYGISFADGTYTRCSGIGGGRS